MLAWIIYPNPHSALGAEPGLEHQEFFDPLRVLSSQKVAASNELCCYLLSLVPLYP